MILTHTTQPPHKLYQSLIYARFLFFFLIPCSGIAYCRFVVMLLLLLLLPRTPVIAQEQQGISISVYGRCSIVYIVCKCMYLRIVLASHTDALYTLAAVASSAARIQKAKPYSTTSIHCSRSVDKMCYLHASIVTTAQGRRVRY
jgi:hypothetical protein